MNNYLRSAVRALVTVSAVVLPFVAFQNSAYAQLAGTVWIDFVPNDPPADYPTSATLGPETSFADAVTGLNGLAGLTNAQIETVENDVTTIVRNDFGSLSINITSNAGDPNAVNPSAPPSGDYTTVVLGAAAGGNANVLGLASEIDWRNLNFNDSVGISVPAFNGFTLGGSDFEGPMAGSDDIAQALANTVAHEIGHVLGLVHTDAAATYSATPGTDAQKKTAVQNNDLMRANVTSFASATSTTTAFNSYSQLKLSIAANGIMLENQAAETAMGQPNTVDPISETADTNTSMTNALPLLTNGTGMVNVLGQMQSNNIAGKDYFSFTGYAGQTVDFEVYALGLESESDNDDGRIPNGGSIGTNELFLLTAGNNLITGSPYPMTADATGTNYDGSTRMGNPIPNSYGDALIYNYSLTATGTYYVELDGSRDGLYELFAVVPEPSSFVLAGLGVVACAGYIFRRRAGKMT